MMYQIKSKMALLVSGLIVLVSCHGLEDLNENPSIPKKTVGPGDITPMIGATTPIVGMDFTTC